MWSALRRLQNGLHPINIKVWWSWSMSFFLVDVNQHWWQSTTLVHSYHRGEDPLGCWSVWTLWKRRTVHRLCVQCLPPLWISVGRSIKLRTIAFLKWTKFWYRSFHAAGTTRIGLSKICCCFFFNTLLAAPAHFKHNLGWLIRFIILKFWHWITFPFLCRGLNSEYVYW